MCATGHLFVDYVQTMRWWSSNLRQRPFQNLGSVAILDTLFYPALPTCLSRFCIVLGTLLLPNTPPSVAVHCLRTSLSHPLPNPSLGAVRCPYGRFPYLPPVCFRRSSLRPALRACTCCFFHVRSPPLLHTSA